MMDFPQSEHAAYNKHKDEVMMKTGLEEEPFKELI